MGNDLVITDLGFVPFAKAWDLQRDIQRGLIERTSPPHLLLCEHPPVVTLGRSASQDNLLVSKEQLVSQGIECFEIERGGDVTFHGPGQLVVYPLLDLRNLRRDVGWFMRTLEAVVVSTLEQVGVPAVTIEGKTGVWIRQEPHSTAADRKIASIGIRLSRWCTLHGLSLNVTGNLDGFSLIHPCGFTDIEITSIEQELACRDTEPPSFSEIKSLIVNQFCETFGYGRKT